MTKIKTTLEKDIAPNYALVPIIAAHAKASIASSSSSVSPALLVASTAPSLPQMLSTVTVPALPPAMRPIVSVDQVNERIRQLMECQMYLRAALDHLPLSVGVQQAQIIGQFNLLKQAIEVAQNETLQNLAALQVTVSAQLQQELLTCDAHLMEVSQLRDRYPGSVLDSDIAHWIEAEDAWRSRLAIIQQHGLLGAFSAQIPLSIAAPTLTYEGHSIDFPALWAISRDPTYLNTIKSNKAIKPIHFLTQSASGMIRRWDFRDRITISEVNHPGLRSWSLFEKGSKLVAASAKIKVYDTFTGQCLATFDSLSSPAKRIVASGCELKARAISFHVNQGTAAMWDLSQNIRMNWDYDISTWNTNLVTPIATDSPILLVPTIAFPFNVLLFNLVTGELEEDKHLEGFQTDVVDIVPYGEGGRYCVTLCTGGVCTIWDLSTRKVIKSAVLDSKHKQLSLLKLNKKAIASGKLPIVAGFSTLSGSISIWCPAEDRVNVITHNNSTLLSSSIRAVLLYDEGRRAMSGHANGRIYIWDLVSGGQCIDALPLSITGQFSLCNKGHNIVVGTPNGYVNVIDTAQLGNTAVLSSSPGLTGTTGILATSGATNSVLQLLPSALDGSGIQLVLIGAGVSAQKPS